MSDEPLELSPEVYELLKVLAKRHGYESVEQYAGALIHDDVVSGAVDETFLRDFAMLTDEERSAMTRDLLDRLKSGDVHE